MSGMLNKNVIVVTGGAGFLGQEFCRAIARNGGIAIVADRDIHAARRTASEIEKDHPGCAEAACLDITKTDSVDDLIRLVFGRHGRIDAVVNNAYPRNGNYGRKLEEVRYDDFCENVGLHLGGYFLVAQRFSEHFKAHQGGNIVNLASIYGIMAPRFDIYEGTSMTMPVEYAAIKSAVIQLTKYFSVYYKGTGIRVNCLSPGGILDNQPESFLRSYNGYCSSKGMLNPGDISESLLFLLSEKSRHINGQNIVVDDGFSL